MNINEWRNRMNINPMYRHWREQEQKLDLLKIETVKQPDEWKDEDGEGRIDLPQWIERYEHEKDCILSELNCHNPKILELGSGPGKMGNMIQESRSDIEYHYIDKQAAKDIHKKRNYSGKFFVKDLYLDFDTTGLDRDFDMVVANDFLEHIANPSTILVNSHEITKEDAKIFVSVPNWRMGHVFIYRGVFDYDNWLYTMHIHGWDVISVYTSPLGTPDIPKIDSEKNMPEEMRRSWNWYFVGQKRKPL